MKNLLLASCAGIMCFGLSTFYKKAHAQPAQEVTQIAMWIKQQKDNLIQLKQLYDNYVMVRNTWNAVSNARDVSSMISAIGVPTRRFLPDASDLVYGIGTGTRLVENAANVRSANQLFALVPQSERMADIGGRWADEMSRRETTTANVQSTAEKALQDVQDRISRLNLMQARIAVSPDAKDIADVKANIDVERHNLALHSASLQALQLNLMAADRMEAARKEQIEAQGARRWADATKGAVDQLQGP